MGKGFAITSVLGGSWNGSKGTELVVQEPSDEIEWPHGELPPAAPYSTAREDAGFGCHMAEVLGTEAYKAERQDRIDAARIDRAITALSLDGGP